MSLGRLLLNASAPSPTQSLLASFNSSGLGVVPSEVRGDAQIAISITPVVALPSGSQFLWEYDNLASDIYRFAIGNPDGVPDSGSAIMDLGGTAFTWTAGITAAAATIALQAASTTEGLGTVTVTLLSEGAYMAQWAANGAVPAITETSNSFNPASSVIVSQTVAGDGSNPGQQIIQFVELPVVYAEPATQLATASVSNSTTQAPTATLNAIRKISFPVADTFGGTFSVVVLVGGLSEGVGVANPQMTAQDFAILLSNHSLVFFQNTGEDNNISVTKTSGSFIVEFLGDLGGPSTVRTITSNTAASPTVITTSANHNYANSDTVVIPSNNGSSASIAGTHTITVLSATTFSIPINCGGGGGSGGTVYNTSEGNVTATNIDLMAPKGVSGFVDFSSVNLWKAFGETDAETLDFTVSVERERVSGEVRTLWLAPITLYRDLIDVTSLQPLPHAGIVYVGDEGRWVSIANGMKGQVSNDGGNTWSDVVTYTV